MKKILILSILGLTSLSWIYAQNRGGYGNNGGNNGQSGWDNRNGNHQDDDVYDRQNNNYRNPYNDPNYYPNPGYGRCGSPPPPPRCYRRPVVVVPPSYCAPVVINPFPHYYGFAHRRPARAYGYGRGHGRRW